jgi:hypothetical protein
MVLQQRRPAGAGLERVVGVPQADSLGGGQERPLLGADISETPASAFSAAWVTTLFAAFFTVRAAFMGSDIAISTRVLLQTPVHVMTRLIGEVRLLPRVRPESLLDVAGSIGLLGEPLGLGGGPLGGGRGAVDVGSAV